MARKTKLAKKRQVLKTVRADALNARATRKRTKKRGRPASAARARGDVGTGV